jgi:hypothetical protein
MVTFSHTRELNGAVFTDVDLRAARFREADLSGVVMRAVELSGADVDAPWLVHGKPFLVNGVNVIPLVESALNTRFPGRAQRRATDPDGLRAAWAALESTWAATLDRAAALPPGAVDVSVDGEWSFAQTLRHLVLATDAWLRRGILGVDQPFHRLALMTPDPDDDSVDLSVFTTETPAYAEVLAVRAERMAMVHDFLDTVTADDLTVVRQNPWAASEQETTLSCLHVIMEEEWEHHRYAVRDLDAIEAGAVDGGDDVPPVDSAG